MNLTAEKSTVRRTFQTHTLVRFTKLFIFFMIAPSSARLSIDLGMGCDLANFSNTRIFTTGVFVILSFKGRS